MNRREQIKKAASELETIKTAFIQGAEWADQNLKDPNDIIIELIHQRSISFDEARDAREKNKKLQDEVDRLQELILKTVKAL